MLRLEGLVKQYKTGDRALKGIDLEVPDGQVMALIGPSGAGKSTLIRCVNRLVEPTSGSVCLNGQELTTLGQGDLRTAGVGATTLGAAVSADSEADVSYEGEAAEIVAEIRELIETRVRPAVAQDGGDIIFHKFEPETGIVHLSMRGACAGCPSSTMTLKQGIENMLKTYVPEVTAVEAVL